MGSTTVNGQITIEPPLTNSELNVCGFVKHRGDHEFDMAFKVRIEETPEETADGTLIRRTGVALEPLKDDPYPAYDLVDHLKGFIGVYGTAPDGTARTFAGHFSCDDADSYDDPWMCKVVDGRIVKVTASVVWPEDLDSVNTKLAAVRRLLARHTTTPGAVTVETLAESTADLCRAVAKFTARFDTDEDED
ncbi:DUF6205 family protein [Actinomadura violacea]|uniref:Uncharacterized protein n=1 Tax=Actinomadura violacea TaxID=2819934 RepID=A0ABS3RXW3_9ACTN|nr:DUF6205 family protein [Actinomadura violacea]MBO2461580.1 hypothetical protein [Actinomadura violacea]